MTQIFSDGYESGDFTEFTGTTTDGTSTLEVVEAAAHAGTYGQHSAGTGGTSHKAIAYKTFTIPESDVVYAQCYLRLNSSSGGYGAALTLRREDPLYKEIVLLYWNGGTWALRCRNKDGSDDTVALDPDLSTETWYKIGLLYDWSGVNPVARIYVDGVERASHTDESSGTLYEPERVRIGTVEHSWSWSVDVYYDEVEVHDEDLEAGGISLPVVMHYARLRRG